MKSVLAWLTLYAILVGLHGCGGGGTNSPSQSSSGSTSTQVTKVYGLNFSPYVQAGQDPNTGTQIPSAQITTLISKVAPYTQWVRTFGSTNGLENVGAIAHSQGLKTAIGAFLTSDATANNAQIAGLVQQAQAGNVNIAIVGSEVLLRGDLTEDQLIAYINQVRGQIPKGIPVTTVDTWNTIVAHPKVIAAVDIVAVDIYPFYENAPINQALSQLQSDYQQTVQAAGGKSVFISETGWPSSGSPPSSNPAAIPSLSNATLYFSQAEQWVRKANIPLFYFEAFDEPFKANHNDYPSWGLWDSSGNLKPGMSAVFQQ